MDDLSLAADFPQATREQWLKLVEGVLKGADFQKKLVSRSHDGIAIQPLYPKAEGSAPIAREQAGRWRVSQRIDHPDPQKANELALLDLEGGADALTLVTRRASAARGFGVRIDSLDDLDRALSGVMLDLIHLRLDAGGHGRQMAALVLALAERRGHQLSDLSLDLGLDPIGAMAAQGRMSASWDAMAQRMGDTLSHLAAQGFAGRAFLADGRVYHEAGASEAQELAVVLATGLGYLRALEVRGHSLDAARRAISFLLVADADEFLTVAKLRALRRLWARVEQACGLEPKPIRLHAETAWRMITRRDPWVNMLRTTVAVFAAGLGGADAITVLPFTAALGLPDAFARRIARNTQLILLEESNLAKVLDPAAGSGGIEALTDDLCEAAWRVFQEIEAAGGAAAALEAGLIQRRIAATRRQREAAVARRIDAITGTSEFPHLEELPVAVLDVARPSQPSAMPLTVRIEPLRPMRLAEPYEKLRDASDRMLAVAGSRPKVFLANLGTPADFAGRATFAKNFFAAGGIGAVGPDEVIPEAAQQRLGTTNATDVLVTAFRASGARLACLCSSDGNYAGRAADTAKALKGAGAKRIYLAGQPKDQRVLEAAGV